MWDGPSTRSLTTGSTFMVTPAVSQASRTRSTSSGGGLGMARSTCWSV